MPRVKIEDLKPPAKDLDMKEMKKLFGGSVIVGGNTASEVFNSGLQVMCKIMPSPFMPGTTLITGSRTQPEGL